ncbi:class I SAM-dependent methyltransferase [Streptomyces diacarni]|uniref:class I SAM-dependent methyltransferase n=1 Tax=Streptomyces diacarni TaxID=2800381 RepID=UPI003F4CE011
MTAPTDTTRQQTPTPRRPPHQPTASDQPSDPATGAPESAAACGIRPCWSADPYTDALRSGHGPLFLRRSDGWLLPLDVERWCASADAADMSVLRLCEGSVLDVGCGPGRLVAALSELGSRALGIDVSQEAVTRTVGLGATALCRSVFEALPGEGRWGSVLLLDGNIGIGGRPGALLERCGELLAPEGLLLAEAAPVDVDERVEVRIDDGRGAGEPVGQSFPWARVGARALLRYAAHAGWSRAAQWESGERSFLALRRS